MTTEIVFSSKKFLFRVQFQLNVFKPPNLRRMIPSNYCFCIFDAVIKIGEGVVLFSAMDATEFFFVATDFHDRWAYWLENS